MSERSVRPAFVDRQRATGKLTAEQKADVVRRYDAGEKVADIAALYGIRHNAVSYHAAKHCVLRRDLPSSSTQPAKRAVIRFLDELAWSGSASADEVASAEALRDQLRKRWRLA